MSDNMQRTTMGGVTADTLHTLRPFKPIRKRAYSNTADAIGAVLLPKPQTVTGVDMPLFYTGIVILTDTFRGGLTLSNGICRTVDGAKRTLVTKLSNPHINWLIYFKRHIG